MHFIKVMPELTWTFRKKGIEAGTDFCSLVKG